MKIYIYPYYRSLLGFCWICMHAFSIFTCYIKTPVPSSVCENQRQQPWNNKCSSMSEKFSHISSYLQTQVTWDHFLLHRNISIFLHFNQGGNATKTKDYLGKSTDWYTIQCILWIEHGNKTTKLILCLKLSSSLLSRSHSQLGCCIATCPMVDRAMSNITFFLWGRGNGKRSCLFPFPGWSSTRLGLVQPMPLGTELPVLDGAAAHTQDCLSTS